MNSRLVAAILGLPALTAAASSTAQTADEPDVAVIEDGNRVIYGPEYFSRYNVVTARDQLERIPGLQGVLDGGGGGEQRGFGNSGDQILINGKRLSGKSNDIGSTLQRIQARQVVRIEVIRGMTAGLDVRSQGRVVNIVLSDTLVTGYGSWEGTWSHYSDSRDAFGVELNYAGDVGALNYLVSAAADPRLERDQRTDLFYTVGNSPYERQVESAPTDSDEYTFVANTSYAFDNGDIINFNALYETEDEREDQLSDRFVIGSGLETFVRHVRIATDDATSNWELGGDYEHSFANGNVLNALIVHSAASGREVSSFEATPAGGLSVLEEIQEEEQDTSEKIARATYRWGITGTSSFESGAELALNTLQRDIRLFEDQDGALVEMPVFNQASTVEEKRAEAFITYSWQARPKLFVEASMDVEFSNLSQRGADVDRSRDFSFARPRIAVRYDMTPLQQIRGRVERTIGQLDFGDFTASFTNDDNRADVISAGNPELVPEQTLEYELTYERRLADDLGLLAVAGIYRDVSDQVGRVLLLIRNADGELEERTATGNIGDGDFLELSVNASLRLSALTLDRAIIEGTVSVTNTDVIDPFTGEERDFHGTAPYEWSLGFRQDTNWRNLSYGFTLAQRGPIERFDLDYWEKQDTDPDVEMFAEMQVSQSLTLRLELEEALRAETQRERFQFIGNRQNGVLDRREVRLLKPVRELTLSVQGVF